MTTTTVETALDEAIEVTLSDPEPLIAPDNEQKLYPIDALPTVIKNAVCTYQGYGQQPLSLVACSALATASLVTQGVANVARDNHLTSPLSLNLAVIAESGERKTSADRRMVRAVRQWVEDYHADHATEVIAGKGKVAAYQAEKDGLLHAIKAASGKSKDTTSLKKQLEELALQAPTEPIMPMLFYEDNSPEALTQEIATGWPSASLWSDEGGLIIGGRGMGDDSLMRYLALLNRMWDGNPLERRRTTAKSCTIKGRRLTCSIMMQYVVLSRLMTANGGASRGMGFLARFLLAWPESTMGKRLYREGDLNGQEMTAWDTRLTELLSLPLPSEGEEKVLKPPALHLSGSAKCDWVSFHDSIEKELSRSGEFGDVADFAAKTAENAARIAGIFHVFAHGVQGEIGNSAMQAGAAIASWHLTNAKRIMSGSEVPQAVTDALLLMEWIEKTGQNEVSPRDVLQKGPNRLRDKQRRDEAAKLLLGKHHLFEINQSSGTVWRLHPKQVKGGYVQS